MSEPTKPTLYDFEGATRLIHDLAIAKGWWNCKMCDGHGEHGIDAADNMMWKLPFPKEAARVTCPVCLGTGKHRNFGESIALCTSELSEALEAARTPELDVICDKCHGIKGPPNMLDSVENCGKCNGTGNALGGSRIAEELVDCIIRILDLCGHLEIDVGAVLAAKHAYNTTRPIRHGKRF